MKQLFYCRYEFIEGIFLKKSDTDKLSQYAAEMALRLFLCILILFCQLSKIVYANTLKSNMNIWKDNFVHSFSIQIISLKNTLALIPWFEVQN